MGENKFVDPCKKSHESFEKNFFLLFRGTTRKFQFNFKFRKGKRLIRIKGMGVVND